VAGELVAVVSVREESVAVKVQEPTFVIVTALKVATPPVAVTESVPPRVQLEVRAIVSVEPVPVAIRLPYWSSTETAKLASVAPAVVVAGGSTVKTTLLAAAGVTVVAGLLVAVIRVREVSVAVRVQMVPLVIVTALKVATPPAAVAVSVPPKVQLEVRAIWSNEPVPVVIRLPYWSSTETAKLAKVAPAVVVAGGSTVKTTLLAPAGLTTVAGVLVAVVRAREESVAVRVQLPVLVIVTALKVATPPAAVTESVPPRVQPEVRAMVSPDPAPVVTTLPYWSSTETAKLVKAVPAVAVVGGSTVKTTLLAAAAVTVVGGALVAVVRVREESVAVKVQVVPLVIVTALKVATPPVAVTESVPPSVQVEVRAIVSVEPVPVAIRLPYWSSTETAKLASVAPAVVVAGGSTVKATLFAAAGVTVVAGLLVAVIRVREVSVAVRVQIVPLVIATALKVATPPAAVTESVPVKVQVEVRAIVSAEPAPVVITLPYWSSTETAKLANVAPAVVVAGGSTVKITLLAGAALIVVAGVLVAVVRAREVSVAVRV
jgi:hypothetical protein